jgi:hypothetical protein
MSVSTYQELVARRAKITGSGDFASYGWLKLGVNPRLLSRAVYAALIVDGVSDYVLECDLALLENDLVRWSAKNVFVDSVYGMNYSGSTSGWGNNYGNNPAAARATGWPAFRVSAFPEYAEYDSEPAGADALVWHSAHDNGYTRTLYRVTCWPVNVIARATDLAIRVVRRSQSMSAPSFAFEFFLACGSAAL